MNYHNNWREKYPYRISLDIDTETRTLLEQECQRVGYNVSMVAVAREILKQYLRWAASKGIHATNIPPSGSTRKRTITALPAWMD